MTDPHPLPFLRIPFDVLIALADRHFQFALQPYHFLIRLIHVLTAAAFFGGIVLFDLRLMGVRGTVPLKSFAEHTLPWLYVTFGVAFATGILLFFYDPVHVGSHGYFTLKLILLAIGLANAALFRRTSYVAALAAESAMPLKVRIGGAVSLAVWVGVMACACLNTEGVPKVFLR